MKCFKCGIEDGELQSKDMGYLPAVIIKHHLKYEPEIIVDCCQSCHQKIHQRIRRNNSCPLPVKIVKRLSEKSGNKRYTKRLKKINFSNPVENKIRLVEIIRYDPKNGTVGYYSGFRANNAHKLYEVEI